MCVITLEEMLAECFEYYFHTEISSLICVYDETAISCCLVLLDMIGWREYDKVMA